MSDYFLADVFLGENDGKKEALYRSDFERFFYDYNNIYENTLKNQNFLVLGRKGSGKTILAEFIKKQAQKEPQWFCEICSYKDFKFHELINLKSSDISPNEYICIWEWVILLDFARNCLLDEGLVSEEKKKLETFFKDNYYSIDIDSKKIVEITKQNKIKGTFLKQSAEHSNTTKLSETSYLSYVENLRDTVCSLLQQSESRYFIFYDELDDKFRNDDYYRNSMISLIKAADKINLRLYELGAQSKVILLMRTDIFSLLNDPDLNKIKMSNAVLIDWGNTTQPTSPLITLILNKIRTSLPEVSQQYTNEELFNVFFPQDIKRILPTRFILERTFFRPRDVITYLNLIIKKYPQTQYFGYKGFLDTKKQYSEYFYQEVRNELSGHLPDEIIDQSTLLLKQFNRHHFTYKEISDYFNNNKKQYNLINLDEILKVLFKFSVIGNKWFNEFQHKDYYCWAYRDNRAELDLNKLMLVHLGLREELSL